MKKIHQLRAANKPCSNRKHSTKEKGYITFGEKRIMQKKSLDRVSTHKSSARGAVARLESIKLADIVVGYR